MNVFEIFGSRKMSSSKQMGLYDTIPHLPLGYVDDYECFVLCWDCG